MKLSKLVLLGLPLVLFGCPNDDDDTDTDIVDTDDTDVVDTDDTDDTDTDPPAIEFAVELIDGSPDQLTITITNGVGDYNFGYAQTEVIAAGGDGWTGEDCYLGEPDTTFQFCHPVGNTGATLNNVATIGEIVEGQTMLLSVDTPAEDTPELTYYVETSDGTQCWVWGHDISYYAALNCEEYMAPM
jgi:hypothetical protein